MTGYCAWLKDEGTIRTLNRLVPLFIYGTTFRGQPLIFVPSNPAACRTPENTPRRVFFNWRNAYCKLISKLLIPEIV